MFSFDLKSSHHHVEVFPYHRQYLPFSWTFSFGFIRCFQFEVSLFGLSSAPYLSLSFLSFQLRNGERRASPWSFILATAWILLPIMSSLAIHADLLQSGFLPNEEKSIWDLAQDIIWLRTVINTSECLISATDSGIYQSLTQDLLFLLGLKDSLFQVRKLASVCSKKIFRLGTASGT